MPLPSRLNSPHSTVSYHSVALVCRRPSKRIFHSDLTEAGSLDESVHRLLSENPWILSGLLSDSLASSPDIDLAQSRPLRSSGKKRRGGADYIPRPPNAFLIFRSDYCAQEKLKANPQRHHKIISADAGKTWRALPEKERKRYEELAVEAKAEHARRYPHYRYSPASRKGSNNVKEGSDDRRRKRVATRSVRGAARSEREMGDASQSSADIPSVFSPPLSSSCSGDSDVSASPQSYIPILPSCSPVEQVPPTASLCLSQYYYQLLCPQTPAILSDSCVAEHSLPFFPPELNPYSADAMFLPPEPPSNSWFGELPTVPTPNEWALSYPAMSAEDEVLMGLDMRGLLEPQGNALEYNFDFPPPIYLDASFGSFY